MYQYVQTSIISSWLKEIINWNNIFRVDMTCFNGWLSISYKYLIYIFELSWLENPANTNMRHAEHWTAVSTVLVLMGSAYRNLQHWRSTQQPQNTEAETLPRDQRFISHICDVELNSHGDNARPLSLICLEGTYSLQRTHPGLRLPKLV